MTEPEGLFRDSEAARDRPIYRLLLRAEPGVNETQAIRRLLKFALRACGLRCVSFGPIEDRGRH
jgi:hypothetical protein